MGMWISTRIPGTPIRIGRTFTGPKKAFRQETVGIIGAYSITAMTLLLLLPPVGAALILGIPILAIALAIHEHRAEKREQAGDTRTINESINNSLVLAPVAIVRIARVPKALKVLPLSVVAVLIIATIAQAISAIADTAAGFFAYYTLTAIVTFAILAVRHTIRRRGARRTTVRTDGTRLSRREYRTVTREATATSSDYTTWS